MLIHQVLYLIVAPLLLATALPRLARSAFVQVTSVITVLVVVGIATWIWEIAPQGGAPTPGNTWLGYAIILITPFCFAAASAIILTSPFKKRSEPKRLLAGLVIILAYGLGVILGLSTSVTLGLANP